VAATFGGSGWTTVEPFDSGAEPAAVSCATSTFCIATDYADRAGSTASVPEGASTRSTPADTPKPTNQA